MSVANVPARSVRVVRQFTLSVDPFQPQVLSVFEPGHVITNEAVARRLVELGMPVIAADGSDDDTLTFCVRCRRPVSKVHNAVEVTIPLRPVKTFLRGQMVELQAQQPVATSEIADLITRQGFPTAVVTGYRCQNPECRLVFLQDE